MAAANTTGMMMTEKMTQKFTAEEVRANIAANRRYMTTETELQLTAYADTLSKPADSGRVGVSEAVFRAALQAWIDCKEADLPCRLLDAISAALAAQGQDEAVAWRIDTDDDLERVAKAAGWDNRRYMTQADYAIWCIRMREFVRLAVDRPAPPAGVPEGWKLVPLKLTDEMFDAMGGTPFVIEGEVRGNTFIRKEHHDQRYVTDAWEAMLAAAPSAPEGDGGAK